jgi:catechol 2,3-dioxygenase-like lactoylglutathione lyase family enzyme
MAILKPHIAIHVSNLQESVSFYRKMFAIEPSKIRQAYAKFDVQNPALNFSLTEASFHPRGALSHLGIQVSSTEDVLAFRERWTQAGLLVRDEMSSVCCYALQDKVWVRDPDGNQWEVFVVLKDNLPEKADPARACCGPTCCAPADTPAGASELHAAL